MLYSEFDLRSIFLEEAECLLCNNVVVDEVCIDSRSVIKNSMFCAIKGPNYDGHDFIEQAIVFGASCVLVENVSDAIHSSYVANKISIIKVKSVLDALSKIAKYRRDRSEAKIIAITGSMGKTSVKHAIAEVLQCFINVYHLEGNLNNRIGVSLILANTDYNAKIILLELGMNHANEIEFMSKIVRPDIAVITNIAPSHIGNFADISEIVKAKAEIFAGMNSSGIVVLNQDDRYYSELIDCAKKCGIKNIFRLGSANDAHVRIQDHKFINMYATEYTVVVSENNGDKILTCRVGNFSKHGTLNAMFAIAIARLFRFNLEIAVEAISKISILEGRGNIENIFIDNKKITVINDSYNSNPEALKSAIEVVSFLKEKNQQQRSVCCIGDMFELGDKSKQYHEDMLPFIIDAKIDKVYTVGKHMKYLYSLLPTSIKGHHFQNSNALSNKLRSLIMDGDVILFKASHALDMQRVVDKLYKS